MKTLPKVIPTSEQLTLVTDTSLGFSLIRGAAGSGKTTSALLRLSYLTSFWKNQLKRTEAGRMVRVLVLTFNRTLRGYITELAYKEVDAKSVSLNVATFAEWAGNVIGGQVSLNPKMCSEELSRLAWKSSLSALGQDFLVGEADYAMGRFLPDSIDAYLTCVRDGRGRAPRMQKEQREELLDQIVRPYAKWKRREKLLDWNDQAVILAQKQLGSTYDVVIVDEAQDFTANQVRAVVNHLAEQHTTCFVIDSAQRLYPRGFRWAEVGISVRAEHCYSLKVNHRNTKEIAAFAKPLVSGLSMDEDFSIPNLKGCTRSGPIPRVLRGKFSAQVARTIAEIQTSVDLKEDSVAFLHPKGWFKYLAPALEEAGLEYVDLTRKRDWPAGGGNIGLSTMHSAKGLEFDHVVLIGLNGEVSAYSDEEGHAGQEAVRRLVAVAITRARKTVTLGYLPTDPPPFLPLLDPATFVVEDL